MYQEWCTHIFCTLVTIGVGDDYLNSSHHVYSRVCTRVHARYTGSNAICSVAALGVGTLGKHLNADFRLALLLVPRYGSYRFDVSELSTLGRFGSRS